MMLQVSAQAMTQGQGAMPGVSKNVWNTSMRVATGAPDPLRRTRKSRGGAA